MAFTSDGAAAYVASYGTGTVSVIDTVTNSIVDTIAVGDFPFGVAVTDCSMPRNRSTFVIRANGEVSR